MLEEETPGELEAFRDEIKKLAEINESLGLGVKNVEDLGEKEAMAWKTYKHLFNEAYINLNQCQDLEGLKKKSREFTESLMRLNELDQFISSVKEKIDKSEEAEEKDKNKLQFLAWIDNLLVLKSNIFSILHDALDEDDLASIKGSMVRKKTNLLL